MHNILDHVDSHVGEHMEVLKRLCSQPSVSAQNLGLNEMAELCKRTMQAYGLEVRLMPVPDGPPIVYGECKGQSPRTLLFYHHYDVQPPEPLDLWDSPPFEPVIRDGRLFGRGVVDNKGHLMTRLAAVKAYIDVHKRLPVSVKFVVEGEEEVGSPHLVSFVETHRDLLTADACLWSGEVTREHQLKIALGLKGMLYVELEARGANQDLHSSRATRIVNPAWRLVWALSTLKDVNENILVEGFSEHVRPPTEADLEALRRIPSDDEKLKESLGISEFLLGESGLDLVVRDLFMPTCTICGIWGGYTGEGSKTVLPSVARAKLDIRLVPDMDPDDILTKLRRHLDTHGFDDISITTRGGSKKAWRTPLDHPFVEVVVHAAREVSPQEPIVVPLLNGSGVMSVFGTFLNVPIATSGIWCPESRIHAPNENLRLEDFKLATKHTAVVMGKLG